MSFISTEAKMDLSDIRYNNGALSHQQIAQLQHQHLEHQMQQQQQQLYEQQMQQQQPAQGRRKVRGSKQKANVNAAVNPSGSPVEEKSDKPASSRKKKHLDDNLSIEEALKALTLTAEGACSAVKTPVSVLQELLSRRGITPTYDLVQIEGAIHEPTFRYRVTFGSKDGQFDC